MNTDKRKNFYNPYNFIPAPPREAFTKGTEFSDLSSATEGENSPRLAPHLSFMKNRWTGRLRIAMETVTPLLIFDSEPTHSTGGNAPHKTYRTRTDSNGNPLIPPTSVKGMIRSLYEAATLSRFGVFGDHDDPLGMRMDPGDAARMIPARFDGENLYLLLGASKKNGKETAIDLPSWNDPIWTPAENCGFAAKVPSYYKMALSKNNINTTKLKTGQKINFKAEYIEKNCAWIVYNIDTDLDKKDVKKTEENKISETGYFLRTGKNFLNKKNERIFFGLEKKIHLNPDKSKILLDNYYKILNKNQEMTNKSMYIKNKYIICYARIQIPHSKLQRKININSLNMDNIEGLYPVTISRRLNPISPRQLASKQNLTPAETFGELSMADRVFGWVGQAGRASDDTVPAYKGNLRIGPIRYVESTESNCPIKPLCRSPGSGDGLPLAILSSPKPNQWRFYLAKNEVGDAIDDGISRLAQTDEDIGYQSKYFLRGRKVFPHHFTLSEGPEENDYWLRNNEDFSDALHSDNQGFFREYVRPGKTDDGAADPKAANRDGQNRSIEDWIDPGCRFEFDIDVKNLTSVELGALLWLLQQPKPENEAKHAETAIFKLGYAKPLGFGSVTLSIMDKESWLSSGNELAEEYQGFNPGSHASIDGKFKSCIDAFISETVKCKKPATADDTNTIEGDTNLENFETCSWIKGIREFLKGYNLGGDARLPVCYPRKPNSGFDSGPKFSTENFKWFVDNDATTKAKGRRNGQKLSLPALHQRTKKDNGSLPFNPTKKNPE